MAKVNLKTDFRNGEKLYDHQLNNNFKALQAALDAANAIVWQDNADKVVTFRGTTEELKNREIINGQILYDTDTGESYIDYEGERISTGSGNAIHIGESEPTNASTQLWIPDDGEGFSTLGTEVVNSLDGNEERMAPSVAAVNNAFKTKVGSIGKRLWMGEFSEGQITVEGISKYTVIAVLTRDRVMCFGLKSYGIGGFLGYGESTNIQLNAYRFNVNGDTLTIDENNKGCSNGSSIIPVIEIYGIF